MSQIQEVLETLPPSYVLWLVAIVGAFVLVIGCVGVLIVVLIRRRSELAALKERLEAAEAVARRSSEDRDDARDALERLTRLADGVSEIWTRTPFGPPPGFAERMAESIPILALANLKGGVGKSTLSANLAAWFDARGERVLVIDLDYQGSLSTMALGPDAPLGPARATSRSGAEALMNATMPPVRPLMGAESNSGVIESGYGLLNDESRILFRWLLGRAEDDIRYRLADLLLAPRVQTTYDRVIIDTPPRITLGLVNALCAATHLLIPTQLNGLSTEAMRTFLTTLDTLRPQPLPPTQRYRILGVQKTWGTERMTKAELTAVAEIDRLLALRGEPAGLFLREAMVPNMSAFQRVAGRALAWQAEPSVRPEIARLGTRVAAFAPSFAEAPETG